ncbi:MAG: penicillin-binding protein 2, partial [Nitrincola sp.]|nr:penicillin-binding protein 2 [Nitrincola sp.]
MSDKSEETHIQAAGSWRIWVVLALLCVAVGFILTKLFSLYSTDQAFLQTQGDARTIRTMLIPAHRGLITDRNGEPLAVSAPVASIWVDPKYIDMQHPHLNRLSQLIEMPHGSLIERLSNNSERRFVYLRRQVTPEVAEGIRLLGIPGVNVDREYRRFYPAGEV